MTSLIDPYVNQWIKLDAASLSTDDNNLDAVDTVDGLVSVSYDLAQAIANHRIFVVDEGREVT